MGNGILQQSLTIQNAMAHKHKSNIEKELLDVQHTLGWMDLVLGNISDAVYVLDSSDKIIFANQYFADLIGVQRVFLLGQELGEIFHLSNLNDPSKEFLEINKDQKKVGEIKIKICELNGSTGKKILKISSRYISNIQQTVYVAKDITLEYEVAIAKDNFVNIASHQLKTPMSTIMTYSHMLDDGYAGELSREQKDMTRRIVTASERMITLISDILLITRLQNGENKLQQKDSTYREVAKAVETEIDKKIKIKNIRYKSFIAANAQKLKCNSFLVHQIISNLIVNAIQYTPSGGKILLNIETSSTSVLISVKDSGIGIPPEFITKIFDQFSRAENAFQVFNEGTGLGLYIVKLILDFIGGTINCISEIGKGTLFEVKLPLSSK